MFRRGETSVVDDGCGFDTADTIPLRQQYEYSATIHIQAHAYRGGHTGNQTPTIGSQRPSPAETSP
jgi:hypothetical protein